MGITRRFINADGYIGGAAGLNLYAYCSGNPVMMTDSTGEIPEWLKKAGRFVGGLAISAVAGVLSKVNVDEFTIKSKHLNSTGGNWNKFNVGTEAEAKIIVKDALSSGNIVRIGNNSGKIGSLGQTSFDALINSGRVIGTNGQSHVYMIYDSFGKIWTVFPK